MNQVWTRAIDLGSSALTPPLGRRADPLPMFAVATPGGVIPPDSPGAVGYLDGAAVAANPGGPRGHCVRPVSGFNLPA